MPCKEKRPHSLSGLEKNTGLSSNDLTSFPKWGGPQGCPLRGYKARLRPVARLDSQSGFETRHRCLHPKLHRKIRVTITDSWRDIKSETRHSTASMDMNTFYETWNDSVNIYFSSSFTSVKYRCLDEAWNRRIAIVIMYDRTVESSTRSCHHGSANAKTNRCRSLFEERHIHLRPGPSLPPVYLVCCFFFYWLERWTEFKVLTEGHFFTPEISSFLCFKAFIPVCVCVCSKAVADKRMIFTDSLSPLTLLSPPAGWPFWFEPDDAFSLEEHPGHMTRSIPAPASTDHIHSTGSSRCCL